MHIFLLWLGKRNCVHQALWPTEIIGHVLIKNETLPQRIIETGLQLCFATLGAQSLPILAAGSTLNSYRSLSPNIVTNFIRVTPHYTCIVDVDLLLAVHPAPGNVQRWVAVKLGRDYLVQLLKCCGDICWIGKESVSRAADYSVLTPRRKKGEKLRTLTQVVQDIDIMFFALQSLEGTICWRKHGTLSVHNSVIRCDVCFYQRVKLWMEEDAN